MSSCFHFARIALLATRSRSKGFCSAETSRNISGMSSVPPDGSSDRPWIELATTKEEREAFYSGAGFAFRNSSYPVRYVQHVEKRAPFMMAYFKYLFESDLISGKAVLGLLKKWETVAGKRQEKIIFAGVMVSEPSFSTANEFAPGLPMCEIDPEAAEISFKREKWMEETIHSPMREVAASMGTRSFYISSRVTMEEYKGKGYGAKYSGALAKKIMQKLMARSKSQEISPLKMPPIIYLVNSDTFPSAFKAMDALGVENVGHYHFHYKSGLKCYLDPSVTDEREICCTFLYTYKNVAPIIRKNLKDHPSFTEKASKI